MNRKFKLSDKSKKQLLKTALGIILVIVLKVMITYLPNTTICSVLEIIVGSLAVTIFFSLMKEIRENKGKDTKEERNDCYK